MKSSTITLKSLRMHFQKSELEASRSLKISLSKLKLTCRSLFVPRWPFRRLRALDRNICHLKMKLHESPRGSKQANEIRDQITFHYLLKDRIIENPRIIQMAQNSELLEDIKREVLEHRKQAQLRKYDLKFITNPTTQDPKDILRSLDMIRSLFTMCQTRQTFAPSEIRPAPYSRRLYSDRRMYAPHYDSFFNHTHPLQ